MEFKSPQICEELPGVTRRCAVTGTGLCWSSTCTARARTEVFDAREREIAMDVGSFLEPAGLCRVRKTTSK